MGENKQFRFISQLQLCEEKKLIENKKNKQMENTQKETKS